MTVLAAEEMPVDAPVLQKLMRAAVYTAECTETLAAELVSEVNRVLAATALPRERKKDGKAVSYDLRPMIYGLWVEEQAGGRAVVRMELRAHSQGARPARHQVLRELGVDPAGCLITRSRLLLNGDAVAGQR